MPFSMHIEQVIWTYNPLRLLPTTSRKIHHIYRMPVLYGVLKRKKRLWRGFGDRPGSNRVMTRQLIDRYLHFVG